jgi:hypothetical protein
MNNGDRILKATAAAIRRGTLEGLSAEDRELAKTGVRVFNALLNMPAPGLKHLADLYGIDLDPAAYDPAPAPSPAPWRFD